MEKIIKGDELMLFNGEHSIAYATSHTLTISGNAIDISSKDHGFWGASEVGNITWEITSENLWTEKYRSRSGPFSREQRRVCHTAFCRRTRLCRVEQMRLPRYHRPCKSTS